MTKINPFASIIEEVAAERTHQLKRWGRENDLTANTPMDWVGYISHHTTRWFQGGFRPYPRPTLLGFRQQMVKVAATAIAAIEATDAILDGKVVRTDVLAA